MADQGDVRVADPQERAMRERIEAVIERIRPAIQADGGDVEFVDLEDGVVMLRLHGACVGCPMSTMTLQAGIERLIRQEVPEIRGVMAV